MSDINDHLILICGFPSTGKSASLVNLRNPEGVVYLNTEAGKRLPFKSKFTTHTITDVFQVPEAIEAYEDDPSVHTIVVDSLTFLMDMFESEEVLKSSNKMGAWSDYQQYFKDLLQQKVARSSKKIIFTAHIQSDLTDKGVFECKIPVKGALKGNGLEAYFSVIVYTKRMAVKELKPYVSDILNITEKNEREGYKYVYQLQLTKDSLGDRIRGPMGMFDENQVFMDNDAQLLLDQLDIYYGE